MRLELEQKQPIAAPPMPSPSPPPPPQAFRNEQIGSSSRSAYKAAKSKGTSGASTQRAFGMTFSTGYKIDKGLSGNEVRGDQVAPSENAISLYVDGDTDSSDEESEVVKISQTRGCPIQTHSTRETARGHRTPLPMGGTRVPPVGSDTLRTPPVDDHSSSPSCSPRTTPVSVASSTSSLTSRSTSCRTGSDNNTLRRSDISGKSEHSDSTAKRSSDSKRSSSDHEQKRTFSYGKSGSSVSESSVRSNSPANSTARKHIQPEITRMGFGRSSYQPPAPQLPFSDEESEVVKISQTRGCPIQTHSTRETTRGHRTPLPMGGTRVPPVGSDTLRTPPVDDHNSSPSCSPRTTPVSVASSTSSLTSRSTSCRTGSDNNTLRRSDISGKSEHSDSTAKRSSDSKRSSSDHEQKRTFSYGKSGSSVSESSVRSNSPANSTARKHIQPEITRMGFGRSSYQPPAPQLPFSQITAKRLEIELKSPTSTPHNLANADKMAPVKSLYAGPKWLQPYGQKRLCVHLIIQLSN
eukprot:sb/3463858/